MEDVELMLDRAVVNMQVIGLMMLVIVKLFQILLMTMIIGSLQEDLLLLNAVEVRAN